MINELTSSALTPAVASPTPEEIQAEIVRLTALQSNQENGTPDGVSTPVANDTPDTIDNSVTTINAFEAADNTANASNGDQPATSTQNDSTEPDAAVGDQAPHAETSDLITPAMPPTVPTTVAPPHIVVLKAAIAVALANPEFVKDIKRVEKVVDALKMPDEEARVRAQLKSHAEKKLRSDAAIEAERTGVYTAPTQAEINAQIEKGMKAWRAKHKK